jgi:class 3 adenylate cyclase/tetratricopeptide (TPR) repeat protein
MIICPSCGRESPADARFCASCGASLVAATAAREERKVVSVVFVDLVGHTARSETADPEDVRATLAPYHARTRIELERFGGTVEKFIGDAVMAVFGAPVAHEDDPERAVRAALAVRDALVDDGLEIRAAVNTGEALVSLDANAAEGEALVAGDVVNTAARLQSAAPVNGVLVGAATHRATERVIEYREAEGVAAKGKSAPVPAWEAVAPRARLGVDISHHGGAELVGRELEVRLLYDALDRARSGSLQLVTLVGVPGMGKSRLVWELFQRIESEIEFTHWRQGRALSYGGGAFGAIAEAVRSQVGALESDSPDDLEQKLCAALEPLPLAEDERDWVAVRLRPLLGLGTAEPAAREESFVAWRRLFEAIADVRPLVLVLEDLHWADEGTLDFAEHLADWATDSPLLVLCTARPELLERRPGWGGGRLNSQTVALAPLADDAAARLLGLLLERSVLDADVQARLLQQTGGNPLYAEEYARMFSQGEVGEALPDTVQGVIAARLDLLEPAEKEVIQAASVLGKVFWRGGVEALGSAESLDETLQRLVRREFIKRERGTMMAGQAEYAFRHALVRDVAYAQLPRASRAEKHRLAANWIETTATGRPDLVAHHYGEALALGRAAGADVTQLENAARVAFRAAGDHAHSLGAIPEAAALYRQALALWPAEPARASVELSLAAVLEDADAQGAIEAATSARDSFAALGDFAGITHAESVIASSAWQMGDGESARRHLDAAVTAGKRSGSTEALARALTQQTRMLMSSGRYEDAIAVGVEAMPLAEKARLEPVAVAALIALGTARGALGLDGWEAQLIEATERSRALNDTGLVHRALNNRANEVLRWEGVAAAQPIYDEIAEIVERRPLPYALRWVVSTQGWCAYMRGEWDVAVEYGERFFSVQPDVRHYLEAQTLFVSTTIGFGRGDATAAAADFQLAMELSREAGDQQLMGPMLAVGAWLASESGRSDDMRAFLDELLALPEGAVSQAADYVHELGWVAADHDAPLATALDPNGGVMQQANRAVVDGRLEDAIALLDESGFASAAAYARLRLARRRAAAGDDTEPFLGEAESFYRGVRAARHLRELDELRATRRSA